MSSVHALQHFYLPLKLRPCSHKISVDTKQYLWRVPFGIPRIQEGCNIFDVIREQSNCVSGRKSKRLQTIPSVDKILDQLQQEGDTH